MYVLIAILFPFAGQPAVLPPIQQTTRDACIEAAREFTEELAKASAPWKEVRAYCVPGRIVRN